MDGVAIGVKFEFGSSDFSKSKEAKTYRITGVPAKMCIRDRDRPFPPRGANVPAAWIVRAAGVEGAISINPVSYTHLDVYKRQSI